MANLCYTKEQIERKLTLVAENKNLLVYPYHTNLPDELLPNGFEDVGDGSILTYTPAGATETRFLLNTCPLTIDKKYIISLAITNILEEMEDIPGCSLEVVAANKTVTSDAGTPVLDLTNLDLTDIIVDAETNSVSAQVFLNIPADFKADLLIKPQIEEGEEKTDWSPYMMGTLNAYVDERFNGTNAKIKVLTNNLNDVRQEVADLPIISGDGENSFKVVDFEGSDGPIQNNVYGKADIALGYGVSAGALSWRISYYTINNPKQFEVYDPNLILDDTCKDKIFGVRLANNFDYWGKIVSVNRRMDSDSEGNEIPTAYVYVDIDTAIEDSQYDPTVGIEDTTSDKNTLKIYDMISAGNISTGNYSFAEGYNTAAQGMISHAEGYNTKAIGKYSHTEGHTTIAGYSSHAEGNNTKALGWNSHSEGSSTTAKGDASHAEGEATTTTGKASHAEGANTEATGWTSHAEGYQSKAWHTAAHAEGKSIASGPYSHSEGNSSASADYAHSEGNGSSATKEGAHAENKATASGKYSHSEGAGIADAEYAHAENTAKAYATYSHAENSGTAYGYLSHAEGSGSTTGQSDYKNKTDTASEKFSGYAAHAEGSSTLARGAFSHAEGDSTKALSKSAHAEGSGSQATGWASHAEGANCTAAHSGSHAEGSGTKSQSEASHSEGLGTTAQGQASHAQGRYNVLNPVNDTYPNKGRYADIVGNGESASARSNAYTLDWLGNGWFAGDVRVGGTSYDNAKKLITIDDIQNNTEFIKKISDIILEEISSDEEEY